VIDLHSHLLPGIDDGSRSLQQSLDTLRRFVDAGITDVATTPHLRASDANRRGEEAIERRDLLLYELRRSAPPGIELHPGFEIMLDDMLDAYVLGDRRFSIAGSRYYLVEFPMSVGGAPATAAIGQIQQAGVTDRQIEDIRFYQRSEAYDDKERATVRFADLVTRGASAIDASVLNWLGRYYSDDEIVELVMVVALANMVNRVNDTLQIEPDLG